MGADNNQIARPLKALRNFKKYEDLFYFPNIVLLGY